MEWLIPYKVDDDEPARRLPAPNGATHSLKKPGCLPQAPHGAPLALALSDWLAAKTKMRSTRACADAP